MVEQGRPMPASVASASYNQYPAPLAKYEDVVADRQLFMTTLEKLHSTMGTKFMIPIIGGRDLDLHKLFVEVTSRGGIEKILREKRWKEVTNTFNFPSTATNASFVLRKYYYSLLHHYERIYYFKVQGWSPSATAALQSCNTAAAAAPGLAKMSTAPVPMPTPAVNLQQPSVNTIEFVPGVAEGSSAGSPIIGVIDGKFDSGYLVTVRIGKDTLKGVLYQAPPLHTNQVQVQQPPSNVSIGITESPPTASGHRRKRRRRRKSELRKRDPSHPKPNRSGYNFFFAEQHARLKPLHPGKDRDISRMIGELWNNLNENEKAVYQEKALKDKERYRLEMEDYREKLRGNEVISDAVPLQQRFPYYNVNMVEVDVKDATQRDSPETPEDDSDSSKSETEDKEVEEEEEEEEDDQIPEKDESFSDADTSPPPVGVESVFAGTPETSGAIGGDFQIVQEDDKGFEESELSFGTGNLAGD